MLTMSDTASQVCTSTTSSFGNMVVPVQMDVLHMALLSLLVILVARKWNVGYHLALFWEYATTPVPTIHVELTDAELLDDGVKGEPCSVTNLLDPTKEQGYLQCFDPSTKQWLGMAPNMTPQQVHECVVKAKQAQPEWAKTSFRQRRLVLRTIQKFICAHVQVICRVSSRDSGKPKVDAVVGEILTTCEKIRTICESGELWLRPDFRSTGPMMMHKTACVEYVPLGVIATIAPWNYPFHNALNHIISALMAGNAHVGKVSEHASWSADFFSRIVKTALQVHGHNPDLVQTITGLAEAGNALVSDPLVDKIIFTGSTPIGRKVMETASHNLTPVILELGGKDAMVLMDDIASTTNNNNKSSIDSVIPWVMRGCFQNSGQNCVGVERVLVYESLYDHFLERCEEKIQALRQGIPLCVTSLGADGKVDCGSMIMPRQLEIVQALVDDAVKKGAKLHCGGKRNTTLDGQFYEPTLLSGVTPDMDIFQQEVFGPVMTVVKVPNNSDEECIRLVNNCNFGLGSSIFTGNAKRGLSVGRQFRTGMLTINDYASNYLVQSLPFGGCKESGFGRFAGIEGLRALCLERSIVVDTFPNLIKTVIPKPIDYPIDMDNGFPFTESLVQLFYNENWIAKLKGIVGLIKHG